MMWGDLKFWASGEWQVIQEKLDGKTFNPGYPNLFNSMSCCPFESVKVAIYGQDPYPDANYCTGLAFSIPTNSVSFPPTLNTIFMEYCSDLKKTYPTSGDLTPWCKQGVFLWNVIPSCQPGRSLSHDWEEWKLLTQQITEELSKKGVVFILLGSKAHAFERFIDPDISFCSLYSHPSPRASNRARHPFLGSRPFSTANSFLAKLKLPLVDWSLI